MAETAKYTCENWDVCKEKEWQSCSLCMIKCMGHYYQLQ